MQKTQHEQIMTVAQNEKTSAQNEQNKQIEQQANQIRLALFLVSWMMGVLFVISNIS
jgi:F0F1-type ATP synthase assembly protein I